MRFEAYYYYCFNNIKNNEAKYIRKVHLFFFFLSLDLSCIDTDDTIEGKDPFNCDGYSKF